MAKSAISHRQLRNVDIRTLARFIYNHWHGTLLPGIKIGSTKLKLAINAATISIIDGIPQSAITAQDEDYDTGHTSLVELQGVRMLIVCDASQNIDTVQGKILTRGVGPGVLSGESEAELKLRCELPAVPASRAVLGDIYIVTATAEVFVFGTTDHDANATNATYRDLIWPDTGPDAFDLTIVGT